MMSQYFCEVYKVCQGLSTCQWFSPATPVYSTNKTDRHNITEILLKVTLNAISLNQPTIVYKIFNISKGSGWLNDQVVRLPKNSYKPINMAWVRAWLYKLQKGCTRLAGASDKVYQLLAHGRWFSPASATTKTGRHDIAEILLKVAL